VRERAERREEGGGAVEWKEVGEAEVDGGAERRGGEERRRKKNGAEE